jgi:hypothetical protein
MEQRCRAPFAGISRIRFQGTVSIREEARMRAPSQTYRIPLADIGIVNSGTGRSMARLMLYKCLGGRGTLWRFAAFGM